jgi:predicted RNase H-like nuclease
MILNQFLKKKIAIDDVLDSWILAITVSKGKEGIEFIPNNYEYDTEGLPMRMAIPKVIY